MHRKPCMHSLLLMSLLAFTLACVLSLLVQTVGWPPHNPYVWVEDKDGYIRDQFLYGEELRIKAYDSKTPYTVSLFAPNNLTCKEWVSEDVQFDSGLLTDLVMRGCYRVVAKNGEGKFAAGTFMMGHEHDVEIVFGILRALAVCFSGFGIQVLMARRRV